MKGDEPVIQPDTADDLHPTSDVHDTQEREQTNLLWSESPSWQASLLARRYEIKCMLGSGGAGTVFRARDLVLGEDVALKVPKRLIPYPPEILEGLRNEVRLARRVTHRFIARVYDLVEHEGSYFLTMEFIDGMSLAKRLGRGSRKQEILPPHEVITLASQITEGLSAAHTADVVHCDLKPENVMLSRGGRTIIMDFGIAQTKHGARQNGEMSGTPAYLSPEQLAAVPLDGRADLFSLGVMMFEMLSGEFPFVGETPTAMALARQYEDARSLATLRPDLPREMVELVTRRLSRNRDDRFASAEALRRALLSVPLSVDHQSFVPAHRLQTDPDATQIIRADKRLRTVGVCRLDNHGTAEHSYLATALSDSLADAIGTAKDVRVVPRSAIEKESKKAPAIEAAKRLGVEAFLCGTYVMQEVSLCVTLKLLAVDSGFQLWTQHFEIPFGQAISLCHKAAKSIAAALTTEVSAHQTESVLDPETISLYLKARQLYTGSDPAFFHHSVELLEQALAMQPDSPLLRIGYAKACARVWFWGAEGDRNRAIEAAEHAVAVAPKQGAAYAALAAVRHGTGELPGAVRALRKGLLFSPQFAELHELLGRILCECGPLSEAVAYIDTACRLDPLNLRPLADLVRVFALTGAWKHVETLCEGDAHDPRDIPGQWVIRGRMALWRKDPVWARHLLSLPADDSFLCLRGRRLLERVANPTEATQFTKDEFDRYFGVRDRDNPRRRIVLLQVKTEYRCFAQMADEALSSLHQCVTEGLCDVMWIDLCPLLSLVRNHPQYPSLHAQVAMRAQRIRDAMDEPLG